MSDTALVGVGAKRCTSCQEMKPLDGFHSDPRVADGHRAICRLCRGATEAARRGRNGDAIRAQQRDYYQRTREEQCAYQRDYRRAHRAQLRAYFHEYRKRHPEIIRAGAQRWNAANPEKRKAHSAIWNAIRRGAVIPAPACEDCGADGYVEAHHDDYSKPLDVRWLCELCHVKADEQRRETAA